MTDKTRRGIAILVERSAFAQMLCSFTNNNAAIGNHFTNTIYALHGEGYHDSEIMECVNLTETIMNRAELDYAYAGLRFCPQN